MASSTPLRRALGPLDVNQAFTPTTSFNRAKGPHPNMSPKPFLQSEEASIPTNISTPEISRAVPRQIEVGSGKRSYGMLEGTGDIHMRTKKLKEDGYAKSGGRVGGGFGGLEKDEEGEQGDIEYVYARKLQVCGGCRIIWTVANLGICRKIKALLAALRRPLHHQHPHLPRVRKEMIHNRPSLRNPTGRLLG
jgi:hypothetical protein